VPIRTSHRVSVLASQGLMWWKSLDCYCSTVIFFELLSNPDSRVILTPSMSTLM